jgi:hypothetical protein
VTWEGNLRKLEGRIVQGIVEWVKLDQDDFYGPMH